MEIEVAIKESEWWQRATAMPDRHFDPDAGISLADHLEAVRRNLARLLLDEPPTEDYVTQLRQRLASLRLSPAGLHGVLTPVALLHDIGKTIEDREQEIEHPLTGKPVPKRHPVVGVMAALQLLPEAFHARSTILALIEEHSTPYAWFVQSRRTGQIPSFRAWARLDQKIDASANGMGILLLSLFKLADIDGHENLEDVPWFIVQANERLLRQKGRPLPVPDADILRRISSL